MPIHNKSNKLLAKKLIRKVFKALDDPYLYIYLRKMRNADGMCYQSGHIILDWTSDRNLLLVALHELFHYIQAEESDEWWDDVLDVNMDYEEIEAWEQAYLAFNGMDMFQIFKLNVKLLQVIGES
jgi:predicted metal-dependent hydrolase